MLISRPAGREAWLVAQAYTLSGKEETINVDFSGVEVLTPSWADEFITKLLERYGKEHVKLQNTQNPSVQATLATLNIT